MSLDRMFELGSKGEDEIPPFVKQVERNLINTHVGSSQVSLTNGIFYIQILNYQRKWFSEVTELSEVKDHQNDCGDLYPQSRQIVTVWLTAF
jgi:hypothetical protein